MIDLKPTLEKSTIETNQLYIFDKVEEEITSVLPGVNIVLKNASACVLDLIYKIQNLDTSIEVPSKFEIRTALTITDSQINIMIFLETIDDAVYLTKAAATETVFVFDNNLILEKTRDEVASKIIKSYNKDISLFKNLALLLMPI